MQVLVIGGAGFLGAATARALLSEGYTVRVLDSLEDRVHPGRRIPGPEVLPKDVEFIRGDVRDQSLLYGCLRGMDAVYHFAAHQDYGPEFSRFMDVNVTGTAGLYETINQYRLPITRVIVASSQAVYGEGAYLVSRGRLGLRPAQERRKTAIRRLARPLSGLQRDRDGPRSLERRGRRAAVPLRDLKARPGADGHAPGRSLGHPDGGTAL